MVYVRKLAHRHGKSAEKSSTCGESSPDSSRKVPNTHTDAMDDIHSPYVLTNSDNPSIAIVSEVLDGTNFSS